MIFYKTINSLNSRNCLYWVYVFDIQEHIYALPSLLYQSSLRWYCWHTMFFSLAFHWKKTLSEFDIFNIWYLTCFFNFIFQMALSMNESSLGGNASTDLMTNPMCNLQLLQVKYPPNHTSPPPAYICQTILQIFAKILQKL